MRMRIHEDDGREIDATCDVNAFADGNFEVVMHSRSGSIGGGNTRNSQYHVGMSVLLRRLSVMGATLLGLAVEPLHRSPPQHGPDSIVSLNGRDLPLSLGPSIDVEALRLSIARVTSQVARTPGARGSGNSTRRVRLTLRFEGLDPLALADVGAIVGMGSKVSGSGPSGLVVRPHWSRTARGQGMSSEAARNRAVESRAMDVVTAHFKASGWVVEDTSSVAPYDLRCVRGGQIRYVEVKGTSGEGDTVVVTRGEVVWARMHSGQVMMAIVSGIRLGGELPPVAVGGVLQFVDPWVPSEEALTPLQYQYVLPK
jgi:hypothetical protein